MSVCAVYRVPDANISHAQMGTSHVPANNDDEVSVRTRAFSQYVLYMQVPSTKLTLWSWYADLS